jgi:hypothetical protein
MTEQPDFSREGPNQYPVREGRKAKRRDFDPLLFALFASFADIGFFQTSNPQR